MDQRQRVLLIVLTSCLAVQIVSATVQRRSFETPNSATMIARSMVARGEFEVAGLRAWQLPAEPLYLAAGFAALPDALWRYLHVPVVVAFAAAITVAAMAVGGPAVGLTAGLLATLDPFVVVHGPVWDDVVLAGALEWTAFALLIGWASRGVTLQPRTLLAIAAVAACAAMTRTLAQVVLLAVAVIAVSVPRFRPARLAGVAMMIGVVGALSVWGVRNQAVLGTFFIGSSHDGESFFESNCAYTREGIRQLGLVGFQRECSPEQFEHAASLSELEANRQFRQYGFDYIAANPGEFAKTSLFKTAVTLSGYDFARAAFSPRNVVATVWSSLTLILGSLGLWRLWQQLHAGLLKDVVVLVLVPMTAVTVLMLMVGPTGLRYRLTLSGALWIGLAFWIRNAMPMVNRRASAAHMRDAHAISS